MPATPTDLFAFLDSGEEEGAEAPGGQTLDAIAEFVVDIGGGDHGEIAWRPRPRADALEEVPKAFPQQLTHLS